MRGIIRDIRKWDAYLCLPIPIRPARSLLSTPQFLTQDSNTHILMAHYYYPNANDALSAKIQFLKEYHYQINHCFRNTWGKGYVLFDTKADVNEWYREYTGHYFYTEE